MYLLGLVNSAFETSPSTGNLELVDLSLENLRYHPPELPVAKRKELYSNGHSQSFRLINGNGNGTHTKIMENTNTTNSSNNRNSSNKSDNGATLKRIARKPSRRPSLEDLPADLYMEPLPPLLSKSPSKVRPRSSWVPEETPVNWLQQDLASGSQEFEQEWWSFCIGDPSKHVRRKTATTSWTSTFESVFADGGISVRVGHHPLEPSTTEEEQEEEEEDEEDEEDASEASNSMDHSVPVSPVFCEEIAENANGNDLDSDEGFARRSQHLESVENNDESRELPSTQTEAQSATKELEIEQQPEVQDFKGIPIAAPWRISKLAEESRADLAKLPSSISPSLSSPVMEKMEALAASSESTYSWIQSRLAKTGVQREFPDSKGLRYSMPKGDDLVQEELSFRLWESEEAPKPRESQDERDSARNGLSTLNGVGDIEEILKEQSPRNVDAQILNLRTLDARSRRRGAAAATTPPKLIPSKVEVDSEHDYPSPSSFTCGLSPTSLFSDDQEPFRSSISSSDDNMFLSFQKPVRSRGGSREEMRSGFRKSPRSVLSQEPDEISCETSDSSETAAGKKKKHQKQQQTSSAFTYLYKDESSDLESPMHAKFRHQLQQPFPAFTYSGGKDMGVTSASSSSSSSSSSSEADEDESVTVARSLQELGLFQEAKYWEPWLVRDGGVLYDSEDLEFLLSPDTKWKDTTTKIVPVPEEASSLRSLQRRVGFPSLIQSPISEEMAESTDGKTKPNDRWNDSPRTEHDSPKTKLDILKTKRDSPKTELESRNLKHDSPKTKLDSLKTKRDSPKTELDILKTKRDSPKTELESRNLKRDSPKKELESPKTKHDSPKTQQESPKTKHDSPKIQQESPKTKHDSPKTQQESPKTKHDSLRKTPSEKKWVPYVTSSLHGNNPPRVGNNPPRVRNPTRGGSQPDNPNFDKTTYQGKASVTKPSTDKTPRRTVNFAPDLVKEIPYSQSTNPATATATATQDRKHHHHHHQPRVKPNVQKTKQEAADMDAFVYMAPPNKNEEKSKTCEAEVEEGPSIMNTRRRWRRNRDAGEAEDSKAPKSYVGGGGSTSWSFSESRRRMFRNRERGGERGAGGMPSCVGRLMSWPRRFAVKVKSSSRFVDSDDDEFYGGRGGDGGGAGGHGERSFAGERSFGNSSRRDAELVRRILKGSHKKYSNLTGDDILKEDWERL